LPFRATVAGMSDFDAVLERLVTDQAFAAALAADPAAALAGYRLDPDEIELLHSQVGGDAGGEHAVEVRTNQSSLFGMLSPLVGMAGALPSLADSLPGGGGSPSGALPTDATAGGPAAHQGFGTAQAPPGQATFGPAEGASWAAGQAGFGPAEVASGQGAGFPMDGGTPAGVPDGSGPAGGPGYAPGQAGFGAAPGGEVHAGFGAAPGGEGQAGFGAAPGGAGLDVAPGGQAGFGSAGVEGFGAAPGHGGFGPAEDGGPGAGWPSAGGPAGAWPPPQGAGPAGHLFPGGLHQGGGLGFADEIGDALTPGGGLGFGDEIGDALTPGGAPADASGGHFAVPEGYHAGLDLDGDGRDDEHILRGRADGGVDILVDRDGDGQVDIIGHDDDADGHVESADYDKDGDGHFERTRYDDDGDGWLDRTVVNEEGDTKADATVDLTSIAKHLRMS
jgi:hypothetical protein